MINQKDIRFDLGLSKLLPEWRALLSPKYFPADLIAGITVAFVAIPLSLAIALASGVAPGIGLITAIIAGIVCALFGGTPLAVSGPAAAMCVLIASVVEKYGVASLPMIGLLAGLMQLLSGIFGLGKFSRFVPLPVIAGFTSGIGVIILFGQLPRAFGLEPPAESHITDIVRHIRDYNDEIKITCLLLVALTIAIIRGLPKILPSVPPILPAVLVTTLLVYFLKLTDVPLIGEIPRSLPSPHIPSMPNMGIAELFLSAFTIYMLASLETLLSSIAVDKLTGSKKHDPNQELIGQGLGNIAVPLFGGIPVTGVIARSATNVKAGAKTRRASIIHSLIIILTVYLIAPYIAYIPIVALAAVLFSVAFGMINFKEFYTLWVTSRSESFIYTATFLTIVFVDLIAGVQAGMAAAALLLLFNAAKARLLISSTVYDDTIRLSVSGPLTFLSVGKIADFEEQLSKAQSDKTVVLDLTDVTSLDSSGASAIVDLYQICKERHLQFYIKGLSRRFESMFDVLDSEFLLEDHYLVSEHDLKDKEFTGKVRSSHGRLVHGVNLFHNQIKHNDKRLFEEIVHKQDPHTLFITCSDSRLNPAAMTSTEPGELFIIRNVGNFIPPYGKAVHHSEAAALDFALKYLDITDIVICGHANCGAIKACKEFDSQTFPAYLAEWIGLMRKELVFDSSITLHELAKLNAKKQIENLKEYPVVQERMVNYGLNIYAWFFDFDRNCIYEWDPKSDIFKSLLSKNDLAPTL
ncbi:MAG: bifunctional SulP family inorganic anion transporter/carbonic anhydrase [Gammaproteobacteria bacterium]